MKLLNSPIQKLCSRGAFTDSSVKSNQATDSSVDIFLLIQSVTISLIQV